MDNFDTKYMYNNKWTNNTKSIFNKDKLIKKKPKIISVKNGKILPQKDGINTWGLGCVLDENEQVVSSSIIKGAYGGEYPFNKSDIDYLDETVIFIPIIPKQWGHFIIDAISRLWFILDEKYSNYKILYNSWCFTNGELTGNYKKVFEYLGIEDRMVFVDKPLKVKEILIPQDTMNFSNYYFKDFKILTQLISDKVMNKMDKNSLTKYKKIYFSRTKLSTSKFKEIGEIHLENALKNVGFKVLYPEKLSLEEQIFYFQTADCVVGLSGTIMHNIVFSNPNTKVFILNRTCMPNHPQLMLNKLFDNKVYIVDVYDKLSLKHPKDYGNGPFLLSATEYFRNFLIDISNNKNIQFEKLSMFEYLKYYMSLIYFGITHNKLSVYMYFHLKRIIGH